MIEAWLPTVVSLAMLALLGWFIRTSIQNLKEDTTRDIRMTKAKAEAVGDRLAMDEKEYLTRDMHELICSSQQQGVKLHINEVVRLMREETEAKFAQLWTRLDELREIVKDNGRKNGSSK